MNEDEDVSQQRTVENKSRSDQHRVYRERNTCVLLCDAQKHVEEKMRFRRDEGNVEDDGGGEERREEEKKTM